MDPLQIKVVQSTTLFRCWCFLLPSCCFTHIFLTCSPRHFRHLAMLKTGFCVAKVVKTFGCIAQTTETLDEFRYETGGRKAHDVARIIVRDLSFDQRCYGSVARTFEPSYQENHGFGHALVHCSPSFLRFPCSTIDTGFALQQIGYRQVPP